MSTHRLNRSALAVAVCAASLANPAHAADDKAAPLTWNGITLYGAVDIGVAYQNHGVPVSQDMYTGVAYLVTRNSRDSVTSIAPNGMSQSKLGLKGDIPLADDLSGVFNFEMGFNPHSGKISDALASLVSNNGVAREDQRTAADGSRAGQIFNGPAFLGLSSKRYGTLSLGRHNTLLTDVVGKYDPLGLSLAFSLMGASGTTAGGGNTQNVRLDNSIKYTLTHGAFHGGLLYQPGNSDSSPGKAAQLDLGLQKGALSVDVVYAFKNRAINAASLSASQFATPGVPHDSLAATVSDNRAIALAASYKLRDNWKISGGHERIRYRNPSDPLQPGFHGLGGYLISFVNNAAFPRAKHLQVSWLGANWQIDERLSLTGAWYHYDQNSYGAVHCTDRSAGTCQGTLDAWSAVLDYRFNKRFDVYGGAMYSRVSDGLSSGFWRTSVVSPMVGARLQF